MDRDRGLTRRAMLGGAAVAVGAAAPGLAAAAPSGSPDQVPLYGPHQAGIATRQQSRLHAAAFDVITPTLAGLRELMRAWSDAAARMVAGRTALPLSENGTDPPADTGEALGLPAANLTITFGFGRTLFELAGSDRFGLAPRLPPALAPIPAFRGDQLDAGISDGDVFIQICADDAQVTFHALRNLIRISLGAAAVQWEQVGFGRVATTSRRQATPRNLHGFKDGTNNIKLEDAAALRDHVWVPAGVGPAWMAGGSYAVIRRIRMLIERWDNSKLADQERTIGRRKQDGAPLGQAHEHDPVLLGARRRDGALVIPARAHIRHAAPASNQGARLLRRGYSFVNGIDERTRQLDAGLFFIAYQRDPRTQFVPIQRRLSEHDELAEYVRHIGSGVYACPPGIRPGGYVGETLLG